MNMREWNKRGLIFLLTRLKNYSDGETVADVRKAAQEDLVKIQRAEGIEDFEITFS